MNTTRPTTGDVCPQCQSARLQVLNSIVVSESRVRYFGCRRCGFRPEQNVVTVPLTDAPKRIPLDIATCSNSKAAPSTPSGDNRNSDY